MADAAVRVLEAIVDNGWTVVVGVSGRVRVPVGVIVGPAVVVRVLVVVGMAMAMFVRAGTRQFGA